MPCWNEYRDKSGNYVSADLMKEREKAALEAFWSDYTIQECYEADLPKESVFNRDNFRSDARPNGLSLISFSVSVFFDECSFKTKYFNNFDEALKYAEGFDHYMVVNNLDSKIIAEKNADVFKTNRFSLEDADIEFLKHKHQKRSFYN